MAILVGLLAPQYTKYVEKSRKAADASNLENMVKAVEIAAADASESIPAGEYTIKINKTVAEGSTGTVVSEKSNKSTTEVTNALKEFVNDTFTSTVTKSKKWSEAGGNSDGSISATITVNSDGATSVTYNPTTIKDLSSQK